MAGNTFGQLFRITSFGESHGGAVGAVADGCPHGIPITEADIQKELDRRKPGQSKITTPRKEEDKSAFFLAYLKVRRQERQYSSSRTRRYASAGLLTISREPRPSHADFTYTEKYGIRDSRGSGRASARETLARVAAGAIAKKFLKEKLGVEILSYVEQVGTLKAKVDMSAVTPEDIEANIIRCPDQKMAEKMIELVDGIRKEGDSVGGVIRGLIKHVPKGLGEPVFDKLSADLGKAMLSINAVKGFDIGSGFECVAMRGSEHNDPFTIDAKGEVRTTTNHAGGTLGGISNGEDIYFRVAFKPVSTIRKKQHTVNTNTHKEIELEATGRHDPCVLPRAVPIVDAMSALVIMDHYLRNRAQNSG